MFPRSNQMTTRKNKIDLRLSDRELERLNRDVKKAGMSREAYLRQLIKKIQPKELPSADYTDILKNLRQIGNNMNQIAAKANATGVVDAAEYWKAVRWLEKEIGKIIEVLY